MFNSYELPQVFSEFKQLIKVFEKINRAYNSTFKAGKLSIGLVIPIEKYDHGPIPSMKRHTELATLADELGFKALWVRDIPFNVPSFGDTGQMFDPFTYLGFLSGQTKSIALGVSSIALPLHHPLDVIKSATSIDQLSDGRMLLGIASGDRPQEYPALNIDFENRGALFQESFKYITAVQDSFPVFESKHYGSLNGHLDMLPKPTSHKIPLLMTGSSRQTLEWNVKNTDGWMNYPRNLYQQKNTIAEYRSIVEKQGELDKPFMQPLYVDLMKDEDFKPEPIHLGFRIGVNYFNEYIQQLQEIGVNHLALNLRFNQADIKETLHRISEKVLHHFHQSKTKTSIS